MKKVMLVSLAFAASVALVPACAAPGIYEVTAHRGVLTDVVIDGVAGQADLGLTTVSGDDGDHRVIFTSFGNREVGQMYTGASVTVGPLDVGTARGLAPSLAMGYLDFVGWPSFNCPTSGYAAAVVERATDFDSAASLATGAFQASMACTFRGISAQAYADNVFANASNKGLTSQVWRLIFADGGSAVSYSATTFDPAREVPEPSTYLLFAAGLAGVALRFLSR